MTGPIAATGARGVLAPLRHRDFALLATGQALSTVGDTLFAVALPFLVFASGGPGELAAGLVALGVARLAATPAGGLLTDRYSPRLMIFIADVGRAVVVLALVAAAGHGGVGLRPLVVAAVLIGALEGLYLPAYRAIAPTVLPADELAAGNVVGETLNMVAAIGGPLVAGLATATIGAPAVIRVDAATFAVSGVTLLLMRTPWRAVRPVADRGPEAPVTLRAYLRGSPATRAVLALVGALTLATAGVLGVALPVLAARADGGSAGFGRLLSANAVGLLLGAAASGRLARSARRVPVAAGLLVAHGSVLVTLPHLPGPVAPMVAMAALGAVDAVIGLVVLTMLQSAVPAALRGRAMAAYTFVGAACAPLSTAAAGPVVAHWGPAVAFAVAGAGVAIVGVAVGTRRDIRSIER